MRRNSAMANATRIKKAAATSGWQRCLLLIAMATIPAHMASLTTLFMTTPTRGETPSPPEIPVTPNPQPEIPPSTPSKTEIAPPQPGTESPQGPQGPEIVPEPAMPEGGPRGAPAPGGGRARGAT